MNWSKAIALWDIEMAAGNYSCESVRTWRSYLVRWGAWCCSREVDPLRASHLDVKAWLGEQQWSPACHKSARSALGSFYRLMVSEGIVKGAKRNPMSKVRPVRQRPGVPRPADEDAVLRGMRSWDPDVRLMVGLMAFCGLRLNEATCLHSRDLDRVQRGIVVHGKGGKDRWIPVCDEWMWRELTRRNGYIFPGGSGGHLHRATVAKRVRRATGGYSPHTLRHRYASRVYEGCADLIAVQQLLGHASVATTQIYVGMSRERLRRAAEVSRSTTAIAPLTGSARR